LDRTEPHTYFQQERLAKALAEVLEQHASSPVVGNSKRDREALAISAVGRIESFHLRKIDSRDRHKAIADLAKGISAQRWDNSDVEGSRFQEYQRIAAVIFDAYGSLTKKAIPNTPPPV
jgi:hypothetical protein